MGTTTPTSLKHLFFVSIVLTIYQLVCIVTQWSTFSISLPIEEYERRYSQSQYVLGENKTEVMGDGDIYTYAGIRYLKGEDPTKINFEHPPLSKYLFGLSFFLTGKPNWILVPLFFIGGFTFWFLTGKVTKSYRIRWLAVLLFLGHSTIYATIFRTMLDFPMMVLLLVTTAAYIFFYNNPTKKKALIWGITGGLLLSTQYPIPLLVTYLGLLTISLMRLKVPFIHLLIGVVTVLITYICTYASFLLHGNSLIDLVKFEWWRLHWFLGKVAAPKGLLWQTIFTGRYPRWWEDGRLYTYAPHWNLFWPISILLYACSWLISKVSINHPLFAYKVWVIIALVAFSLGVAEDRFLIPLIPGFALFGASFVEQLIVKKSSWINRPE